jgi:hypothetical protein
MLSTGEQLSVVEISAPEAVRTQTDKAGYVRWRASIEFLQ